MTDITYCSLYPNIQFNNFIRNIQSSYNHNLIDHINKSILTDNVSSFFKNHILELSCLIYIMNKFPNTDLHNSIHLYTTTIDDNIKIKNAKYSVIYGNLYIEDFKHIVESIDPKYDHLYINIFNDFFNLFHLINSSTYKLNFNTLFESHSVYYIFILDILVSKIIFLKDLFFINNKFKHFGISINDVNSIYYTINKIIGLNKFNINIDCILSNDIIISNYINLFDNYLNDLKNKINLIIQKYYFSIEVENNIFDDSSVEICIKTNFTIFNTINHIEKLINHITNPYYNLIKLYKLLFTNKINFYNQHNILHSNIKYIISNAYVLTYSDDIIKLLSEIILFHSAIYENSIISRVSL